MATAIEFLGISPMGSGCVPAIDPAKADVGRAGGRARDGSAAQQPARRAQIITRAVDRERHRGRRRHRRLDQRRAAPAGHRARSRASRSTIDDFDRISRASAAARRPQAGRPVRRHRPAPRRRHPRWSRSGCSTPGCSTATQMTVTGQTIGEEARSASETPGQEVVRPLDRADQADRRAWSSCRATSRPKAPWSRSPATNLQHHRGPARVFDSEEAAFDAVLAQPDQAGRRGRHPLRRPEGRARACARCSA